MRENECEFIWVIAGGMFDYLEVSKMLRKTGENWFSRDVYLGMLEALSTFSIFIFKLGRKIRYLHTKKYFNHRFNEMSTKKVEIIQSMYYTTKARYTYQCSQTLTHTHKKYFCFLHFIFGYWARCCKEWGRMRLLRTSLAYYRKRHAQSWWSTKQ
jgi:hypothetical protein